MILSTAAGYAASQLWNLPSATLVGLVLGMFAARLVPSKPKTSAGVGSD